MISRTLETRIAKLEVSWRHPGELLLVWRRPKGDVRAAVSKAKFAPDDRVICVEWLGDDPLPAPRWFRKRSDLSVIESEYLYRSITSVMQDGSPRDTGVAYPDVPAERMCELHDSDLLHVIFGVAT